MSHGDGVVYMAAKKYYFGVGGGSRRFISLVEKDGELFIYPFLFKLENGTLICYLFIINLGVMAASLIAEVGGGSSNVREVWKLQFK